MEILPLSMLKAPGAALGVVFSPNQLYFEIFYRYNYSVFFLIKNHAFCLAVSLILLTGVDWLVNSLKYQKDRLGKRFGVYYSALSVCFHFRLTVKLSINSTDSLLSVTSMYPGACWLEREVWDLFGVQFVGNSDSRRLLLDYGFRRG